MNYGRHRILKELGRGSMGVVYQAHDPQIDRMVALKVLRPDRVSSEAFLKRFLKEAKAIGRLSHPNIVVVYDIGQDHETVFISMEFLEGRPLSDIIQDRSLTTEEIVDMGIQVAQALDYAHRKGIVHRDIKPSNIIVQPDGLIKITDFGIAHIENPDATQQTQAGEILGTPAYMSPEQVLGRPVDGRSDLFSLGVILYEMVAGMRPFRGENIATIFQGITNEEPSEPVRANPNISKDLSRIIMQCLLKEPAKRFSTGREVAEALKSYRDGQPRDETLVASPAPGGRRARLLAVLATLLVVTIAAFSAYFAGKKLSPEPPKQDATNTIPPGEPGPIGKGDSTQTLPADTAAPALDVTAKPGVLQVDTTPSGAQVLIDGQPKGVTPLHIELPSGYHEVRLTLADYGDWAAEVKVNVDKVTRVPVELLPFQQKTP